MMIKIHDFDTQVAQGDILITRIHALPAGLTKVEPTNGKHVVAHSETGHHHQLAANGVERWESPNDPLVCYLRMEAPSVLEHARPFDTHEFFALGGGATQPATPTTPAFYEIRRQREFTPRGWERVQD